MRNLSNLVVLRLKGSEGDAARDDDEEAVKNTEDAVNNICY